MTEETETETCPACVEFQRAPHICHCRNRRKRGRRRWNS
jgi:hypothetical protein